MNSERSVIDAINALEASQWAAHDELIDLSLEEGPGFDDYSRSWHNQEGDLTCTVCMEEWHGLATEGGCPGEFAPEAARQAYQEHQRSRRPTHHWITRDQLGEQGELPDPFRHYRNVAHTERLVIPSIEMRNALNEHIRRYPQDEEQLMHRWRGVLFSPTGQPLPYTREGLVNVLRPDSRTPPEWHVVEWAQRQLGVVPDS